MVLTTQLLTSGQSASLTWSSTNVDLVRVRIFQLGMSLLIQQEYRITHSNEDLQPNLYI